MVINRFPGLLGTVQAVTEMLPAQPKRLQRRQNNADDVRVAVTHGAQRSVFAGGALRNHLLIQKRDLRDQSDPAVLHKLTGLLRQLFALEKIAEQSVFFRLDGLFKHCMTAKISSPVELYI